MAAARRLKKGPTGLWGGRSGARRLDHVEGQPDGEERERRLALLLADGSGDFDFCRAVAFESMVILQGYVTSYEAKQKAEALARHVGFTRVLNALRVYPRRGQAQETAAK